MRSHRRCGIVLYKPTFSMQGSRSIQFYLLFSVFCFALCYSDVVAQQEPEATKRGTQAKNHEKSEKSTPPGYSTTRIGSMHDFDYFVGGWTTRQRRLKVRGIGSQDWEEFPGNLCMSLYLDGMATVDELFFPTKGTAGLTLRTFDPEKRQWSIYWVSSATGRLDPVPVI